MSSLRRRLGLDSLLINLPKSETADGMAQEDIRPAPVEFFLHRDGQRIPVQVETAEDSIYFGVDEILVTKWNFVSLRAIPSVQLPALGHSPVAMVEADSPESCSKRLKSFSPVSPVSITQVISATGTPRSLDTQSIAPATPLGSTGNSGWEETMDCDGGSQMPMQVAKEMDDREGSEVFNLQTYEVSWKDTRRKGTVVKSCHFSTTVAGYDLIRAIVDAWQLEASGSRQGHQRSASACSHIGAKARPSVPRFWDASDVLSSSVDLRNVRWNFNS